MSINDLYSKLTPRQLEIAIEAIGHRASGSPAEVALQILQGVAVLDGGHIPAVAWPEGFSLLDKAKWHAEQAENFAERNKRFEEFRLAWTSASSTEHPEFPSNPDRPGLPETHALDAEQEAPGALPPCPTTGLRDDDQARRDWYDSQLKRGVYQTKNHSTSDRNPRDQK